MYVCGGEGCRSVACALQALEMTQQLLVPPFKGHRLCLTLFLLLFCFCNLDLLAPELLRFHNHRHTAHSFAGRAGRFSILYSKCLGLKMICIPELEYLRAYNEISMGLKCSLEIGFILFIPLTHSHGIFQFHVSANFPSTKDWQHVFSPILGEKSFRFL